MVAEAGVFASQLLSNPPKGEYVKGVICQLTTSKQSDMIFWTFTHWFMDSKDEVNGSRQSLFRRLGGKKKDIGQISS